MKLHATLIATAFLTSLAFGIERKPINEVDTEELAEETQLIPKSGDDHLTFVWWVPTEFWAATLAADPTVDKEGANQFLSQLEPYMILAGTQADIDEAGNFSIYDKETFSENISIKYRDKDGNQIALTETKEWSPELTELLGILKPILGNAMGDIGQNIHFIVFPAKKNGTRIVDPYIKGELEVLAETETGKKLNSNISFPLNSLYVPRRCPNGEDAHISWKFCPWTGEELPE